MKKIINYLNNKKYFFHVFFLILIIFIAFLLRSKLYFLGDFNYNLDQSRDLLLVKDIVEKHKLTLIGGRSGFGGIFHGPLWLYIILPFFIIAKGNPFFTLVPLYIFFDIGLIILGYYLISILFNKTAGLIFALFLSISGSLVGSSLNFSNSNITPLIFLIYLFLAIKFLRGKNNYLVLILFTTGIGFQFQSAFAIFLLPLTFMLIFLKNKLPNLKIFILSAASFVLSLTTFLAFDIRHHFLMTQSALKILTGKTPPMAGYKEFASFGFRIIDRFNGSINYFFRPFYGDNLIVKTLTVVILVSLIAMIVKNKKQDLFKKEVFFLFSIPILYFSIYVFYPYPLWSHYTNALTVSSCLLLSLAISKLLKLKLKYISISLTVFFLILLTPIFAWIFQNYFFNVKTGGGYKKQLLVAQYIFNDAKNMPFGYLVYDHGQLTYNMDYLMWWLANEIYHVPLINNKQPITYLIIYTPPAYAKNGPVYWKKDVIKTQGTIIGKKVFSKDISVEKLRIDNINKESPVDQNYFQNLIFR